MRFKLIPRFLLFAGLCVCLTSGELWLRHGLAAQNSRIVFTSRRDGNNEIYVMDADGGNQENLTNNPAYDADPDWSPDGTKIAFVSNRSGVDQIYVMDADGNNPIRLTDGPRDKWAPDWSPDGQKIAFTVDADRIDDWVDHIAVIDADGNNRVRHEDHAMDPSWSPDGQQIAYMSEHKGFLHIYVIDTDGKNRKRLTHNEENHWDPAWSPDGQTIAYRIWDGILDGNLLGTIHLMTADGKYLKQLSDVHNARDYQPDISPLGLAVSPASKITTTWGRLKKRAVNLR